MTISIIQLGAVQLNVGDNTVTGFNKPKDSRIAEHRVPGRNNNIYQVMGQDSRNITISGRLSFTTKDTTKATLEGYKGTTQTFIDGEISITVIVESVDIPYDAGQPTFYSFTIVCKEYSQT